ncbi:hypothetical protein [Burkholderia ubonensis]|uniref:Uncharacterized protein n=1 Tax=Burkholderia ubonensis TaxID=101571 RepID=A0ABD4DZL7_9BURK|nr:hypothetical protein [Burkholderia ubonensis]KVN83409.1 hypothetical protein WJ68_15960 [Burkholderia ubonensis]
MKRLKLSKKVQSLVLPTEGEAAGVLPFEGCEYLQALIRAQWAAGGIAKDGSINVEVTDAQAELLRGHATARLTALEASLANCATDEERKPFFGENSAWRAVMRQLEPVAA